ncbi:pseudouridine synthase [Clostridia bacterium]|nr:pseudouridine synthase [Clostridia bacterium]
MIRLNKYIASSLCSRRKADEYISGGQISVNGAVVTALGTQIDETRDVVTYEGRVITPNNEFIYIMLHKPAGCVTTVSDQFARKTVLDYVDIKEKIFPIGRLDYNTSGLLLLTNDGNFAEKIIHPRYKIEKTYFATVKNRPTRDGIEKLRNGVFIDGRLTAPAKVSQSGDTLTITITEGRNRQIRKMCESIKCPVVSLSRIRLGHLSLDIPVGKFRHLSSEEIGGFPK